MSKVSFSQVQAALRVLGITDHDDIAEVHLTPKQVDIYRHAVDEEGKTYLAESGELATRVEVLDIYRREPHADAAEIKSAHVTVEYRNGFTREFRINAGTELIASISTGMRLEAPTGTPTWLPTDPSTIDLHLYGKGTASQLSASQPMPVGEETAA